MGLRFGGAFFDVFTAEKTVDRNFEKIGQTLHRVEARFPFAAFPIADGRLSDPEGFCEGVLGISCVFSQFLQLRAKQTITPYS